MDELVTTEVQDFKTLSVDDANALVVDHAGWAESIARSVARSWNLDWKLDGLDGAAMEALIFCSRRFQPARGVPFKGYARKRIHEASTDAAKKSRGWRKGLGTNSKSEQQAREISAELFNVFPELREGQIPYSDDPSGDDAADMRSAIRGMLVGASLIAVRQGMEDVSPEDMVDYKRMLHLIADLDAVHQTMLWEIYWEGHSMRTVASNWEVDELSVIREHRSLLGHLQKGFAKKAKQLKLKVRPALKETAIKFKRKGAHGPFSRLVSGERPHDQKD